MLMLDRVAVPGALGGGGTDGPYLGAAGLGVASALGAWAELALLRRALRRGVPELALPAGPTARMAALALAAAVPAALVWWALPAVHVAACAAVVLGVYAAAYLGLTRLAGISEASTWLGRLARRRR
jgi:peptidoglycan biosynthesis protein MviN/MurJ (putative lipid II flippase)